MSLTIRLGKLGLALSAALLLGAPAGILPAQAAVGIGIDIGPDRAPPRLRVERRPPIPHPGWAWRAGHWNWVNHDWVWVGGEWAAPPRIRAAWIPGHWDHRGRHWEWVEGHWN